MRELRSLQCSTHQLNDAKGFPRPSVCGFMLRNGTLFGIIHSTFSFDGPSSHYFDKIPFAFLCKAVRKSLCRFDLSRIQLKGFLEALRSSSRIWG